MSRSNILIVVFALCTCEAIAGNGGAKAEFEAVPPPDVHIEMGAPEENPPEEGTAPDTAPPAPTSAEKPDYWKENEAGLYKELDAIEGGAAAEAESTTPTPPRSTGRALLQSIIATCAVIAMILILQYLIKRFGKRTPLLAGVSLGQVMGKLHLTPKASLVFVRVKDRVLVLGLTPNEVSRVAEYDAAMFTDESSPLPVESAIPKTQQQAFLNELKKAQTTLAATEAPVTSSDANDDWVASMRKDLERFQQNLEEFSRDTGR